MDVKTGEQAKGLIEQMLGDRANWETTWEKIAAVMAPSYSRMFQGERAEGERVQAGVFDSTAQEACEKLGRAIHTLLASPATPWFNVRFEDEELREDDEAREWLEECNERMRDEMNNSGWDQAFSEVTLSLSAFAAAVPAIHAAPPPWEDADPNGWYGLQVEAWPLYECVGLPSYNGTIQTVGRKLEMNKLQITQRFENLPPEVEKEDDPSKKWTVFYLTWPRRVPRPEGRVPGEKRPYGCMYVFETGFVLEDTGYYEQAVYMPRWTVRPGDIYGYGPGERAQPEATTLNEARRLEMLAWERAIDPPIWVMKNKVDGNVENKARGITYVRDPQAIGDMPGQTDFQPHMIEVEQSRRLIRDIFLYDQLELPRREDTGAMTAYEVQKRLEQAFKLLGPVIGRLQREVLSPAIQRVFGLLLRGGQLPQPPAAVLQAQERQQVTIEYDSPLTRAQRMDDVDAIDRWVQDSVALAGALPEEQAMQMLDLVDLDEAQRIRARRLGVPESIIRNKQMVVEARERRQQQQEAMMAIEMARGAGEAGQAMAAANPEGGDEQ